MNNSLIHFVELPMIVDDCNLVVAEFHKLPFVVQRLYYIYSPATTMSRGFHAHYENRQILFCLQGSVKMVLDDGKVRENVTLSTPSQGILLETMIWHEMHEMSENTILLVLASHPFTESDYIRNYQVFKQQAVKLLR